MPDIPTQTDPPSPRPTWASLTLRGAGAMALAYAAGRLGVHLGDDLAAAVAQSIIDLVFAVGLAAVGIGRARAKAPLA